MSLQLHACPRCQGTVHQDHDGPACLSCGWSGQTIPGPVFTPEGRKISLIKYQKDRVRRKSA